MSTDLNDRIRTALDHHCAEPGFPMPTSRMFSGGQTPGGRTAAPVASFRTWSPPRWSYWCSAR
ncbi:hypothetical protein [Fodinicola feengrottensis]|uniref:hypothetical protein n=1 Tax=Fodinicola feengrottensis TaxID=435914 RepID=UPI0013D51A9E|nr:hypothetical protein [Fodinicola feengrottensis]